MKKWLSNNLGLKLISLILAIITWFSIASLAVEDQSYLQKAKKTNIVR